MIDITAQILKFRDFLVHSWHDLDLMMSDHDWDNDMDFTDEWLQVNWEFLVERQLLRNQGYLQPYFFSSIRITHPNAPTTHQVLCQAKSGDDITDDKSGNKISKNINLYFGYFVTKMEKGYGLYPPFDYLIAYTWDQKQHYYIPAKEVCFFMSPTRSSNRDNVNSNLPK